MSTLAPGHAVHLVRPTRSNEGADVAKEAFRTQPADEPRLARHGDTTTTPAARTTASPSPKFPSRLRCSRRPGLLLFGLHWRPGGYGVLAAAVLAAAVVDRRLAKDLLLIGFGLVVISLVPINTDISWEHMLEMGVALSVAVCVPYLVSRHVYRDHAVRFPIMAGHRWTTAERWYLVAVVVLGWALLPAYMIGTGVYLNWPAASDPSTLVRLFVGTNALGIWDELFFICTCFALLRRHLIDWQANLVQAVLFTSFLWELGFHAWGPLLISPFALVQGWIFKLTRSLTYVVCVHLLFDLVLFLVLAHAHNPQWLRLFVY